MSVLIIAEASVNHNEDLDLATRLTDVAAKAGADLVKFQTFSAERLAIQSAPKAHYKTLTTDQAQSQFAMLRQLELTADMHHSLIAHCQTRGIGFFSAGLGIESLDYLASLGAERFKVPSCEIANLPYLRHIGAFAKPVILSTGMASLDEIESAIDALEAAGTARERITILHCNTEYPSPMDGVNLRTMQSICEACGVAVGHSDHTPGIEVPIAAVALGATVIEKHLTLDRNLPGPHHKASLEPKESAARVRAIRNIELALGDGIKRPSPSESKNMPIARKSFVAGRAVSAGDSFTPKNINAKSPRTGISPMRWDEVFGTAAHRGFAVDALIDL